MWYWRRMEISWTDCLKTFYEEPMRKAISYMQLKEG